MDGTFTSIAVGEIRPSPYNHRRTFTGLEELGDSIAAKGLAQPILVRPSPPPGKGTKGKLEPTPYELVCGERRWRAAKLRGIEHLPAVVRELDDAAVIELQLIENVQRADVHPLEEADGYRDLLEEHGYTVDQIVAKTGKSRSWVYGRLKLCSLAPEVRQVFLDDKISTVVAMALARLPLTENQVDALPALLGDGGREVRDAGLSAPMIEGEDGRNVAEPLTNSQALHYLRTRYMLDLSLAKFPLDDKSLVPDVGDCVGCVYRTGNQPDLFGDGTKGDTCTKPPCFERKNRAWFDRLAKDAKAKGLEVIAGKKAEQLFHPHTGDDVRSSDYARLDQNLEYTDGWTDWEHKPPTFEKALGKELLDKVPRAIVQAPSGAAVEVIDRKAAVELLLKAGKIKKDKRRTTDDGDAKRRRDHDRRKRVVERVVPIAARRMADAYKADSDKAAVEFWRWLALEIFQFFDATAAAKALKLDDAKKLEAEIKGSAASPAALRYVIAVFFAVGSGGAGSAWDSTYSKRFLDMAKRWEIDVYKIAAIVKAEDESAKLRPKKKAEPKPKKASKKGGKS